MAIDPIRHVILVIMENRSFDHILGGLSSVYPDLDGVNPAQPRENRDSDGTPYLQAPTQTRQMQFDPKHERPDVSVQLSNWNSGFVADFSDAYPQSTPQDRQEVMGYYPVDFLPAIHSLARDFSVCDRWYSSVPGPTWPNRFFALSGTSLGRIIMPNQLSVNDLGRYFQQTQYTVFDRLNEAGRNWKVYFYDFPSSWLLLRQLLPHNVPNYRVIDEFFQDVRNESTFPEFTLIEPKYFGEDENDDHPPHNIMKGEKFIADVYNAIRSSPDLWNSSLFVMMFDEHGGFYDHVTPPGAMAPDDHQDEYTFDRLGLRVPALLISPWTSRRVEHTQFDHTSLLKYLTEKWNLGPLGRRTAAATSIGIAIHETAPRTDTIPFIRVPYTKLIPERPDWEKQDVSAHHQALQVFAQHLQDNLGGRPANAGDAAAQIHTVTNRILNGDLKLLPDLLARGAGRR
jgi:phospholipase C